MIEALLSVQVPRRLLAGVLAFIGLSGCLMSKYPPEDFFTGKKLALAQAIRAGDIDRARALGAEVEDLNAPGNKGMTLLWFAIQEQNTAAITALVALGARPDENIAEGIGSAVDYAMYHQDTRFLEAMLDGGMPVGLERKSGTTLMHRAAGPDGATLEHVKLLVKRGANIDARNRVNRTPLLEAISTLNPEVATYLVKHGADVNAVTTNGVSIMWGVKDNIDTQQPGSQMREKFERLRDLMIEKGAQYPPLSPQEVRERARAQGFDEVPQSLDMLD